MHLRNKNPALNLPSFHEMQVIHYASERIVPLDKFVLNAMDGGGNSLTSLSNYFINTTSIVSSDTTGKISVPLSSGSPSSNSSIQSLPVLILFEVVSASTTVETYRNVTMHTEVSSTEVTTYNTSVVFTVTRTVTSSRVITASMNDTNRQAYPYTVSDNTIFNRSAVLVASQNYHRNGSLSVSLASGVAVFTGMMILRSHFVF